MDKNEAKIIFRSVLCNSGSTHIRFDNDRFDHIYQYIDASNNNTINYYEALKFIK